MADNGEDIWTSEKEDKAFELWQSKSCLFGVSAELYISRTAKWQAVTGIAAAVGLTGRSLSCSTA